MSFPSVTEKNWPCRGSWGSALVADVERFKLISECMDGPLGQKSTRFGEVAVSGGSCFDPFGVVKGSKGGAVVRAPASHQCGPGSNPGVDAICGLSLLLVLSLAPRGFSPGTPVFPSPQKLTFPNSNSTRNHLQIVIYLSFIYLYFG